MFDFFENKFPVAAGGCGGMMDRVRLSGLLAIQG